MFIQTEQTPNPNTLKFLPGKKVSEVGPLEFIKDKTKTNIQVVNDILFLEGVEAVFFGDSFITVKKKDKIHWEDIKHDIIAKINDYYSKNSGAIIKKESETKNKETSVTEDTVVLKIKDILDKKIRPAVARDGGDIKFVSFKNGTVKVELQGSCSGCPSSIMTLKQGVQNLLCHYIKEVKQVEAM